MEVVTRKDGGLFPKPNEIELDCSCPDWADMCKHVAASLYGIGARLDERPELLFELREVDHLELIAGAGDAAALGKPAAGGKTIAAGDLADVFGIELDEPAAPVAPAPATPVPPAPATAMPRKSKAGVNKTASKAASKSRRPAARAKPGTAKTRRAAPAPEPVKKPRRRARKTQLSKS
jgi:uncharacterized Zn finger protein